MEICCVRMTFNSTKLELNVEFTLSCCIGVQFKKKNISEFYGAANAEI